MNLIIFVTGFIFLILASFYDLKDRKVKNMLWILFIITSIIILLINDINYLKVILALMGIGISYLIYITNMFYAGADCKAFMCLALLTPIMFFDILFISFATTILFIPLIKYYKKISWIEAGTKKDFPFMVSILSGFVFVQLLNLFNLCYIKNLIMLY